MSVESITHASNEYDPDDLAPEHRRTPGPDGGHVPGGLAGYTFDGAAYCPECAEDIEIEDTETTERFTIATAPHGRTYDGTGTGVGIIHGWDEWDYPGASCDVCLRVLQTNLLVYEGDR